MLEISCGCLKGVWKLSGGCLAGGCLAGVLRVSGGCYEQIELIHHIFWENRWWLHRKLVTLSHHT